MGRLRCFFLLPTFALSLLLPACSTEERLDIVSGEALSTSDHEAREAQIVGASPPNCAGGQSRIEIPRKTRYNSYAEEHFAIDLLVYDPVYCTPHDIKSLIAAAHEALASIPELCSTVQALPDGKGWNIGPAFDQPPDEMADRAVGQWVRLTNGGPVGRANGDGLEDIQSSASTRYLESEYSMALATEHFCET